jgi:hypothetical protein
MLLSRLACLLSSSCLCAPAFALPILLPEALCTNAQRSNPLLGALISSYFTLSTTKATNKRAHAISY